MSSSSKDSDGEWEEPEVDENESEEAQSTDSTEAEWSSINCSDTETSDTETSDSESSDGSMPDVKDLAKCIKENTELDKSSQIATAEQLFAQKKFSKAYDHYFMLCGKDPIFLFDSFESKLPSQIFLQSRLVMCLLGSKRYSDVPEFIETLLRGAHKEPCVLESLALWLFAEKSYLLCIIVSYRGLKLYPDRTLFEKTLVSAINLQPDVCKTLNSLNMPFFRSNSPLSEVLEQSSPETDATSSGLKITPKATFLPLLLKRVSYCLTKNKLDLTLDCFKSLSDLDPLPTADKVMYNHCKGRVLTRLGSPENLTAALEILNGCVDNVGRKSVESCFGIVEVHIAAKDYKAAESKVREVLDIMSRGAYSTFSWPKELRDFFPESNGERLKYLFEEKLSEIKSFRLPEAICRFENCVHITKSGIEPRRKEIYADESVGYNVIKCTEKCVIEYHQNCWKKVKEELVDHNSCLTPDCNGYIIEVTFKKDTKNIKVKDPILNLKPKVNRDPIPNIKSKVKDPVPYLKPKAPKEPVSGRKQVENVTSPPEKPEEALVEVEEINKKIAAAYSSHVSKPKEQTEAKSKIDNEVVSFQGKSGGAIAKVKPITSKQKWNQKLSKLEDMRVTFQNNLKALLDPEKVPQNANTLGLFFSLVDKTEAGSLVMVDDGAFVSKSSYFKTRQVADGIREAMREFHGTVTKKKKEDRKEINRLKHELAMERELTYYLFQCGKKLIAEKRIILEQSASDLEELRRLQKNEEMKLKQENKQLDGNLKLESPGLDPFSSKNNDLTRPKQVLIDNAKYLPNPPNDGRSHHIPAQNLLTPQIPQSYNKPPPIRSQASHDFQDSAIICEGPKIPNPAKIEGDPILLEILRESFPEKHDLIPQCIEEHNVQEMKAFDEAQAHDEKYSEDILEAVLEMKEHGILESPTELTDSQPQVLAQAALPTLYSRQPSVPPMLQGQPNFHGLVHKNNSKTCSICLDNLGFEEEYLLKPCLHAFHEECVKEWLYKNSDCPLCRKHIKLEEDYPFLPTVRGRSRR